MDLETTNKTYCKTYLKIYCDIKIHLFVYVYYFDTSNFLYKFHIQLQFYFLNYPEVN